MRTIELVSTTSGSHYLLVGFDADSLASFKWTCYVTKFGKRSADFVQSLSLGFVSFMGGDIWLHNSNDVPRASLFGEQKEVKVAVVANQEPNLVRILDSIGLHTDGTWSVESVIIPKTLNTPNGQYSIIPKERFKKREGIYQAEFLRNGKTTSATISPIEYIKGESLRGNSAVITLKNNDTQEVRLYKVDLYQTSSR